MVLDKTRLILENDVTMKNTVDINPATNIDEASPPQTAEEPEQQESTKIEVVSLTEEDLPTVETPSTLIVSPLGSFTTEKDSPIPQESPVAASPTMPITKVQPFIHEDDLDRSWKTRVLAHRLELLIAFCLILPVILALCIGLGVGLSCVGKFRCGTSSQCISSLAQCDGKVQCENQEDELGCVRLSGRNAVLQLWSRGEWRTVCADNWNNVLGLSACKQLGYSRYVESFFISLTSAEQDLQTSLISINYNHSEVTRLQKMASVSKPKCSTGMVTTLKCIECGSRPLYTTRIVGGNISKTGQFPWQVSLHFKNEHQCGGSIITPVWILTAAHCVYGFDDSSQWTVFVGLTEQPINKVLSLDVKSIIYHAQYRPKGLDHDIALMKLDKPLVFNGLVQPICLPNHGEDFAEGTTCWISGWGATDEEGETSIVLRSAMVPLISTKTCNQPEVYKGLITSWMICAGYLQGGIDSCQGDSGGPLAFEQSSTWKLIGATSWGVGCAERNKPGVYTRITQALNWIRLQMERDEAHNIQTQSTDN